MNEKGEGYHAMSDGNYIADRETNPTSVTFSDGRRVWLNSEGGLDVGWAEGFPKPAEDDWITEKAAEEDGAFVAGGRLAEKPAERPAELKEGDEVADGR